MGAIGRLMKRWGFVRLDQFGLTLTAENRVLATRPVLDDGFGGRIVGWRDDDLAALQLEKWPASVPAVVARPSLAKTPTQPAPIVVRAPLPLATIVAEPEPVDEDDWEWTIAMAR
ncbi:MAG: hypothetical protein JWO36_4163, partial [Myxococcales bacterium]|nr:hypothetical protein [Myxococcales bacterium]